MGKIYNTLRTGALTGALLLAFALAAPLARAKDLHGRLGIGYNGQFSNNQTIFQGVPGISFKYSLTRDFAASLVAGMRSGAPTNSVVGLKVYKNIFLETNLNFYFFAGAGLLQASGESGSEFLGGPGVEFFIPGIESLGFSVETGASLSNITGDFHLKTIGVSFLDAGIHFYF